MYSPSDHYPSGLPKPPEGCRFTPFCPSPEQTEELVHALASPEFSLRSIAEQHGTTLEALTSWMALPEIQDRLDNLEQACARRVRLVSSTHLQSTVTCLTLLIDDFKDEITHTLLPHGKAPPLHILEHRRRSRDTIRKVCALLLRLANFHPSSAPPRQRCAPTKPRPPAPPPPSIPDLLKMIEQAKAATAAGLIPINDNGKGVIAPEQTGNGHSRPPAPPASPHNCAPTLVNAVPHDSSTAGGTPAPPNLPDPSLPRTSSLSHSGTESLPPHLPSPPITSLARPRAP